jgi:hypothetical protein
MALAYWVAAVLLTFRSVVLGYLLATGTYDATFFTYINYALLTLGMALLVLSMWSITAYQLWVGIALPLLWGTTVFVALAIIVIVQLNDGVFLRTTIDNEGTNSVSVIHTGDWVLHQLPFVEILVLVLLLSPTAITIFHNLWRQLSTGGKVAYTAYFHLAALMLLSFYMINVDYSVNYPTDLNKGAIWGITIVLALVIELLLFGFLYISKPRSNCIATPTLKQHCQ